MSNCAMPHHNNTMSESSRLSGEAFASERLRNNPQLTFEDLRQAAEEAGVTIQPIHYGRARRQLGLTGAPPVQSQDPVPPGFSQERQTTTVRRTEEVSLPMEYVPAAPVPADTSASEHAAPLSPPAVPIPTPDPVTVPTSHAAASPILAAPSAAPKRNGSPAFDFLVESLRAEPTLSYRELQTRSMANSYRVAPIMYGRAKALLGLVPVAPRGQGKSRKPAKQTLQQADAGSSDHLSQELSNVRSVEDLVQIIKHLDDERKWLRSLLENIANLIDEALDYSPDAST
ncbi:MAG: hypothetical protein ACI8UD_000757 [Planctomycetota bacterium]